MRILTADASDRSIVGVVGAGTTLEEIACECSVDAHHYAESLAPMVERATGGYRPDMIVAGTGPAAFTGLCTGLVTTRAFSRAWGVPFYGVSSPGALVLGDAIRGLDDILVVIDAERCEFFVLRAHPLGPDDVAVVPGPEIVARANLHAGPETTIVTPNPDLCPKLDGAVAAECRPEYLARRASVLLARKEAGEGVCPDTEPRYLRCPDVYGA